MRDRQRSTVCRLSSCCFLIRATPAQGEFPDLPRLVFGVSRCGPVSATIRHSIQEDSAHTMCQPASDCGNRFLSASGVGLDPVIDESHGLIISNQRPAAFHKTCPQSRIAAPGDLSKPYALT